MAQATTIISDFSALERLAPAWQDLMGRSDCRAPTLSPTWLLAWWRVFGGTGGRKLRAFAFWKGKDLVGLFPLLTRRYWYPPAIPFRRLEPLGTGEDEADETCSDYLGIVADKAHQKEVVANLAELLAVRENARPALAQVGPWDELVVPAMDGASTLPAMLASALSSSDATVELAETNTSHYIPLPSRYEDYLASLPSQRRYLVTRSMRDFDEWARGGATYAVAGTLDELHEGKRILRSLHQERWAAEGRRGAFESQRFSAFHDSVMGELFARGAIEVSWLSVRGEPIAALYNIVHGDKVFFYQCGRKMDVPKKIRPGIVIQAHAIRRAIAGRLVEYDFLPGVQQYKVQLSLAKRPIVQLRVVRTRWLETGRKLVCHARQLLPKRDLSASI